MAYDANKDKVIKVFTFEYEGGSLLFAITSYNGGGPKLQISRTYNKNNGETGYAKAGRLTLEETQFLFSNSSDIVKCMEGD